MLRRVLREADPLPPEALDSGKATSLLTEVECLRSLDRMAQQGRLTIDEVAAARGSIFDHLASAELVPISMSILRRAGEPLPTPLGTLDAIHLVSALSLREELGEPLVFGTHDLELARCARACGLQVVGI